MAYWTTKLTSVILEVMLPIMILNIQNTGFTACAESEQHSCLGRVRRAVLFRVFGSRIRWFRLSTEHFTLLQVTERVKE